MKKSSNNQAPMRPYEGSVPVSEHLTEDEESDLVLFFRTCVISNNMDVMKEKLMQSIGFRSRLLMDKTTNIHEAFGFFYISSDLVKKMIYL